MASNNLVDSNGEMRRYEALLQTADLVVHHQELPGLFRELALRLRELADFELASFSLHDSLKNVMRVHTWEGSTLTTTPDEVPVDDSTSGWVWRNQQPLVVPDERLDKHFPASVNYLRTKGIRSYCTPSHHGAKAVGCLGVGQLASRRIWRKRPAFASPNCGVGRAGRRERIDVWCPGAGERPASDSA